MRKAVAVPLFMALLLGSGGCASGDEKEPASSERATCEELLGKAGVKWLKNSTTGKLNVTNGDDLKSAKSLFYKQARAWDPKSEEIPNFANSRMCGVVKAAKETSRGVLSIYYGPSVVPFDFPFGEESDTSDPRTVTPVNANVKLVHEEGERGAATYYVYIKCRVPGAPKGQDNVVPIEGRMKDTLTGDTGTRVHLERLLYSAHAVAQAFECKNKPTVPTELPAGVK
ncbi:hypothetical protein [Streptomyces avermitilis]|nr:hypothetical protein SAV31267_099110 [Streptomyces avermitilis]